MSRPKLICIAGPTASGKTALSIALAKQLDTEIISSDSMQLYRGMDIGTAKPDLEERSGVVHHMFDVAEPGEAFSVARYQQMADACAQDILSRGRIPIVCGGTGLYLDALIEGSTFSGDAGDTAAREKYQAIARTQGVHTLHEMLRAVDPESAARIHENNVKRVVRALEVYEQTGMTIGALNAKNKRPEPKYDAILFALCPRERQPGMGTRLRQRQRCGRRGGSAPERPWRNRNRSETAGRNDRCICRGGEREDPVREDFRTGEAWKRNNH